MSGAPSEDVTRLLLDPRLTNTERAERLLPLVYKQLRAVAQQRMAAERAGHTLDATALVHEAYLRLVGDQPVPWHSRGHFFAAAAEAMRRILIDRARAKGASKRGGRRLRLQMDQEALVCGELSGERLDLDEALTKLAADDSQKAELVKLRFFAGLTMDEAAAALGISSPTADRHWRYARAWLYRHMLSE
jgi:RNA polymerase sigma factor (TIGR02999 family)